MAYEGDVRRVQRMLNDSASNIRSKRGQVNSLVEQRSRYWNGEGAESFSSKYREINSGADQLLRCLDRACDALGQLPSLIARAEREREEKAKKG